MFGDRLHVWLKDGQAADAFAAQTAPRLGATSVRPVAPSLEDVYIARLTAAHTTRQADTTLVGER